MAPTAQGTDSPNRAFHGIFRVFTDAGWRGDDRLAAFGASAQAVARWGFAIVDFALGAAFNERRHARVEQTFQRPISDVLRQWAVVASFVVKRASAARAMLRELT